MTRKRLRGMQLGPKRAVDARATLLLGKGETQNAHEARPRRSFRGQKAVSHVYCGHKFPQLLYFLLAKPRAASAIFRPGL